MSAFYVNVKLRKEGSGLPNTASRSKVWIVIAILLAMFLSALDMTIVGTAMPSIINDLHGVAIYGWVFSAYLLTSTTPVPIYSKLADMYGRKTVFLAGTFIFTLGSVLSGLSQSMPELILFRALQGLGAAGVLPVALTIVGDLFTLEQRAKVQGLFSAVWGLSAIIGPLIGAWIVENASWRWVFEINLPVGIVAMIILITTFHETVEKKVHKLDTLGTILLTIGVTGFLIGLMQTSWHLPLRLVFMGLGILITWSFLRVERSAQEPILPLPLFRQPFVFFSTGVNLFAGMLLFGLISFVPLFVQSVEFGTASAAGRAITPMLVGWPIAAMASSRLIVRSGYRPVAVIGGLLLVAGSVFMAITAIPQNFVVLASTLVIGTGLGLSLTSLLIGLQSQVPWDLRGVVTGSTQFFRTIGGSIGVALMGTLINLPKSQHLTANQATQLLLNPAKRHTLSPSVKALARHLTALGLHHAFEMALGFALLTFLSTWLLPRQSKDSMQSQVSSSSALQQDA
ncbi:MFS transporter [Sulfobacillus thermosulfidooxidans]|nr:MFS transporter [Sulfobacillus thermosulfidooxidans]OLZ13992.1 MFS transporter [Sulfobacillus thermosulfidooxidans]OLZ19916.1 MFS transporter [Sulfobacillus thermosulfidooxidans]